ncbi:MAG TPA: IS1595 family transposase [Stellaceae bacterium]|nr:IS1595 family transposase [Stellaceae bacterium]
MQTPELLSDPVYHDEDAARAYIEQVRWPDFVVCPLCGSFDKIAKLGGKSMGPEWWYCGSCKDKFTVRVGMIFERSHIPLHKWLLAIRLMASSKKGISAHQLHRTLGITYKSAWFLAHRIREAMNDTGSSAPLGGEGAFVEADETYVGGRARNRAYREPAPKKAVVSLVERDGRVRSQHVPEVNAANLRPILEAGIDKASHLRTDESGVYWKTGEKFASHRTVNHAQKEYVRGDASTNAAENFFSILKRGVYGTYQHVSEEHLHRYLAEFDFRHNNRVKLGIGDTERARLAIVGAEGKRLTYRRTRSRAGAA